MLHLINVFFREFRLNYAVPRARAPIGGALVVTITILTETVVVPSPAVATSLTPAKTRGTLATDPGPRSVGTGTAERNPHHDHQVVEDPLLHHRMHHRRIVTVTTNHHHVLHPLHHTCCTKNHREQPPTVTCTRTTTSLPAAATWVTTRSSWRWTFTRLEILTMVETRP